MNISPEEFFTLSTELSERDVKVAELEQQLKQARNLVTVKDAEIVMLSQRVSELEHANEQKELENTYLKK